LTSVWAVLRNKIYLLQRKTKDVRKTAFPFDANSWFRQACGIISLLAVFVLMTSNSALACACCADDGQRYEAVNKIGEMEQEVLQAVKFGPRAQLVSREYDVLVD